ncbi:MAG: hypothetical protein A2Y38_10290 [Spirochaetes bacterium GWB1_59_5]|nr:MAG: hypothetical protein A2Y38_10290 [Spirochaetes bacterium GWB1_59_5]
MIAKLLSKLFKGRIIMRTDDPYLSRWWVLRTPIVKVYVHKFHRSDWDEDLHNHPWAWALSLILKAGYCEERRLGNQVISRLVKPGNINLIRHSTFHRVDLLQKDCWSLFIAGPRKQDWGFWNRVINQYIPHNDFIDKSGAVAAEIN